MSVSLLVSGITGKLGKVLAEEIDKLDRELIKLQMERNVLSKEKEQDTEKNKTIDLQIEKLETKLESLNTTWEAEKKVLDTKRNLNERIDQAKEDLDTCLLYTSPSPRDQRGSGMAASA